MQHNKSLAPWLVSDLSVATFILCMRKLVARRRKPHMITTDNAETFKATKKWFKRLFASDDMQSYLERHGIQWKFNLVKAPWWGGFYERLVGSVKRCFQKVLGNVRLTFEELSTVLTEVEGTLNKRPLAAHYEELNEAMLTPSHLLYGHNSGELPDEVKNEEDESSVHKRLRYMARKRKHFWNHWVKEYLLNLKEFYCTSTRYKGEVVRV